MNPISYMAHGVIARRTAPKSMDKLWLMVSVLHVGVHCTALNYTDQ